MSNYTLETRRTSNKSPRSNFGAASKPTGITIHHWGSPSAGATHNGVVSWLRGRAGGTNNRNSSAHYVVSGRRVTKLAEETEATWHSGNRRGNGTTIGIEVHPRHTETTWGTLVELCADIEERHGSLSYYRHSDWKATACPGVYRTMISRLVNDINAEHHRRRSGGKTKPAASSSSSSSSSTKTRVKRTNQSSVPVMDGRGTSAKQIDTLFNAGYRVNVVSENSSWSQVRNSNGKGGNAWIASRYLNPFFEDERSASGVAPAERVSRTNRDKVPVYAGTGSNAKVVDTLHKQGYRVNVTGYKGDTASWTRVRNSNGSGGNGWIKSEHLES